MAGHFPRTPIRYRQINLGLPSIGAVNAATQQSTIYYYPFPRPPKRKRPSLSLSPSSITSTTGSSRQPLLHEQSIQPNSELNTPVSPSSVYSQDSGIALDNNNLAYDPEADYDMVSETENFLSLEFENMMRTFRTQWEDASAREKSRMRGGLAMLLTAITTGNSSVYIDLSMPPMRN